MLFLKENQNWKGVYNYGIFKNLNLIELFKKNSNWRDLKKINMNFFHLSYTRMDIKRHKVTLEQNGKFHSLDSEGLH